MIAHLSGQVIAKNADSLIISTSGVGYLVFATKMLLDQAKLGSPVECFVYTSVKDDAIDLYGFSSADEQSLFKDLVSVSGVGAKTAINVLSFSTPQIIQAIRSADIDFFTNVPRLGRKNAQKIIIELKNKYHATSDLELNHLDHLDDITKALQSMGYTRAEALDAAKSIPRDTDKIEDQLKIALKALSK